MEALIAFKGLLALFICFVWAACTELKGTQGTRWSIEALRTDFRCIGLRMVSPVGVCVGVIVWALLILKAFF